eukprot:UN01070
MSSPNNYNADSNVKDVDESYNVAYTTGSGNLPSYNEAHLFTQPMPPPTDVPIEEQMRKITSFNKQVVLLMTDDRNATTITQQSQQTNSAILNTNENNNILVATLNNQITTLEKQLDVINTQLQAKDAHHAAQLKTKDEQLQAKDEQIKLLMQMLAEANELSPFLQCLPSDY